MMEQDMHDPKLAATYDVRYIAFGSGLSHLMASLHALFGALFGGSQVGGVLVRLFAKVSS
jgi:hypothetical protein